MAGATEGIRVILHQAEIRKDSLYIDFVIDPGKVRLATSTSLTFTPLLRDSGRLKELPSIILSGTRRACFDRRERGLMRWEESVPPYGIITYSHKNQGKSFRYRLSVPREAWMDHASLEMKEESRDCCERTLLGIHTIKEKLVWQKQTPIQPPIAAVSTVSKTEKSMKPVKPVRQAVPAKPREPAVAAEPSEPEKLRVVNITVYIDYHRSEYEIDLDLGHNRQEVNKIDSVLSPFLDGNLSTLKRIEIHGYASPEGNYGDNERLSWNRSKYFMHFVRDAYGIPEKLFTVTSEAEDWKGLRALLVETHPWYGSEAIRIIDTYGIFAGRESKLMELNGGTPYKEMLRNLFPQLRRIEVAVYYKEQVVTHTERNER